MPLTAARLEQIHTVAVPEQREDTEDAEDQDQDRTNVAPFHRQISFLTVWFNKRRPLSEPKWVRSNSADEWLFETFGASTSSHSATSSTPASAWSGKLEVVDPEPAPTLSDILSSWTDISSAGSHSLRKEFTSSLLATPNDLLEILLRLTRGERNPTLGGTSFSHGFGALASAIRPESPYANHQTHVSLAILQMYRLTMAYASKAGEGEKEVREKIEDIVRSLPVGMIQKSLDGLYKEWAEKRD